MAFAIERSFVFVDSATIAPLARALTEESKLIVETNGFAEPEGQSVSQLVEPASVTVTFNETAFAPKGTPQLPRIWKSLVAVVSPGPPFVLTAFRVSATR